MNKTLIYGVITFIAGMAIAFIAASLGTFIGINSVTWLYYIAAITLVTGSILVIIGAIKHSKKMSYYKK